MNNVDIQTIEIAFIGKTSQIPQLSKGILKKASTSSYKKRGILKAPVNRNVNYFGCYRKQLGAVLFNEFLGVCRKELFF